MKFVNRQGEKRFIREAIGLSNNKLFTLSLYGLRRIGKTRLILELLNKKDLYFFVNKDKESKSLLKEYEEILKKKKILTKLESVKSWEEFFKVLFDRYEGIVAFDEFQNFIHVDKAVFGILQKNIDLNESKKKLLLIFSGSTIGLIKKLFSAKEPLGGRLKRKLQLKQLSFFSVIELCKELNINNIEDVVTLYAVFGGFPKYYVAIEDENLKGKSSKEILEKFFMMENAVFEDEVITILSLEFGKRSGIYYDILTAIANGNTRISKVASFLRKKETGITRQLNELINHFELVEVKKQMLGKKKLLFINHPLANFWFRFFYKDISSYKRREKWLIKKIKKQVNSYVGSRFEIVCEEFLEKLNKQRKLHFEFTKIGKQWGKFKGEKGKNTYEIDVVALNERKKEILFAECRWQNNVNAEKILNELKEKSKYVEWPKGSEGLIRAGKAPLLRKESYAVFAKSFKRKIKGIYCLDLKDMEKVLKKK